MFFVAILSYILVIINLCSGFSYFIFYCDLYFKNPITITIVMKIFALINPILIFLLYFWSACLTDNIYMSYYVSTSNAEKRIISYKYKLVVYLFLSFIITMFSIQFKEKQFITNN